MLGPLNIKLEDYEVSATNAFLPDELPLALLPDEYYSTWEAVISQLPALLKTSSLRSHIDSLPTLSTSHLTNQREWRRAYLILSFFTHGYIWESGGPSDTLPPQISIPFLEIASHLGLPPTATYAAFNLWNYTTSTGSPLLPLSNIANLRSLHTFTGTLDEEWFYLISITIESLGAPLIPLMLSAMSAVRANNFSLILSSLLTFTQTIHEIGQILKRMDEGCDPNVFYNDIRPFLAGSKNMAVAGLPNGVFYDEGEGRGEWRTYSGGSNAQSSIIQFFDVVLGVEHFVTGTHTKSTKTSFQSEMRTYMPGPHRAFLEHICSLSTLPNTSLRTYALNSPDPEISSAFNLAVAELARFRDIHIQIITRYIIIPSRQAARVAVGGGVGKVGTKIGLNLSVATRGLEVEIGKDGEGKEGKEGKLHGTGGTDLLPFLRQSRDETRSAKVDV